MRFDKAKCIQFCPKQNPPFVLSFLPLSTSNKRGLCLPSPNPLFKIPHCFGGPDMFPISDLLRCMCLIHSYLALETRRRERSLPSNIHFPNPKQIHATRNTEPSMCFGSKSSHSASRQPRAYPHPILPQRHQNTTRTTLFPAPRESVLYEELMRSCRKPADRVSLVSLPLAYLPPSHRQKDAYFFQPRRYTQNRPSQQEQDSWHTLRGDRRERIIEVQELQGRWVPEERLGRYL